MATPTPTPTPTPAINGQVIGQAHFATRALLERHLAAAGINQRQGIALNLTGGADGGGLERAALVRRMADGLREPVGEVTAAIDATLAAGLLREDGTRIALSEAGRAVLDRFRAAVREIATQLYDDLPPEDLATAGRVLRLVTERANAVLDATA